PVYVISTPRRPVPLQHFLYSNNELFKIMDHRGTFSTTMHDTAVRKQREKELKPEQKQTKQSAGRGRGSGGGGGGGRGGQQAKSSNNSSKSKAQPKSAGSQPTRELAGSKTQWIALVNLLRKSNLIPVVVFSFR